MTDKLLIRDLPISGKRVLMRVDFNVPLSKDCHITNDTRISSALHSIKFVLEQGGSLILMSHLGRPKGKKSSNLSLKPVGELLSKMLGQEVIMAPDCVGDDVAKLAKALQPGEVMLLENLRFHSAEEHPEEDPTFAKKLSELGELYVDDAFGTAHRTHSSNVEITKYFSGKCAAGFLLEKEIQFLGSAVLHPQRPFYAIIGGAKVSSKINVLRSLLTKVDGLFIGGGMAYTFFKAQGIDIGESLHEDDLVSEARAVLEEAKGYNVDLYLPIDNVVADRLDDNAAIQVVKTNEGIPQGEIGVDIGPYTIELFSSKLQDAKTVLWNGPLGVFEIAEFSKGTKAVARTLANLDAVTIVGGGDSTSAIHYVGYADRISHISTGGGASIEYIEYGKLPGIEALTDASVKA
ncbi:MAG: phosphoglycerate kinase [Chlamydiota bacterium]